MAQYRIWLKSNDLMGVVKTYPFKLQALIWCFLNGYVYVNRNTYFLDKRIEIEEVKND